MRTSRSLGTYSARRRLSRCAGSIIALIGAALLVQSAAAQVEIDAILKIERGGKGVAEASAAAEQLLERGARLDDLLKKTTGANPVAKNWILSLADALADRQPEAMTQQALDRYLADSSGDGEARYWALDRLSQGKPGLREALLDGRTADTSLDIRYEAIELALKKLPSVDAAKADEKVKKQTVESYRQLLEAARLPQQINHIADRLKELGEEVDLKTHFGFVSNWQAIGTFDNRKEVGFDTVYPPESEYTASKKLDSAGKYVGKAGEVSWQPATTDKPDGKVDFNPIFNTEKGAVVYAYTIVETADDVACQVRIGSPNANKVWVNGVEATANNVYHTGSQIDQYVAPVTLKRGSNTVLVKLCQNEQTESWAADFAFQLRFTDSTGLAIRVKQ